MGVKLEIEKQGKEESKTAPWKTTGCGTRRPPLNT